MSHMILKHFHNLTEPSVNVNVEHTNGKPTAPPAFSLSSSTSIGCEFLMEENPHNRSDLEIENATLKCEVIRTKKEFNSKCEELNKEKDALKLVTSQFQSKLVDYEASKDRDRASLTRQQDSLTKCNRELEEVQQENKRLFQQEKDIRELHEELLEKYKVMSSEYQRTSDEFAATTLEKQAECEGLEKKLGDAISEKNAVDESFRLFKNNVLNDLDPDINESCGKSLQIKIRVLQESNAQLSTEVKTMSRRCADAEVSTAALKEELALSDRMKDRLLSSVDNQTREIDLLEKKLLSASTTLLNEQANMKDIRDSSKSFELETIQLRFTNERLEQTIVDLKETNESLEQSLGDQVIENKKWVDRVKNFEKSANETLENAHREQIHMYEQSLLAEKKRVEEVEKECASLRLAAQDAVKGSLTLTKEVKSLKSVVLSLEEQLENMSEMEKCMILMQTEIESKEDEVATLCQAFDKRGEAIKDLERRISLQASEISFLRPERDSKAKIAKSFEDQLQDLQSERAELLRVSSQNDSRGALIDQLKMTISQYEHRLKDIEDDKSELKAARAALDVLKTEHRLLKDDYDDVDATIEQLSRDAAQEIQQREKQIKTLRMLVEEKEADSVRMQAEIYDLKKSKAKLQKHIDTAEEAAAASIFGFRTTSTSMSNDK